MKKQTISKVFRLIALCMSGIILWILPGNAQQSSLITQYMFQNMEINPAYAGSGEGINATGFMRQQWIGFKDAEGNQVAPQTFWATVDVPVKFLHGGAGLSISQDKLGFFRTIVVKLDYAYHMDLGPGDFSAGINLDMNNTRLDFSKFKPIEEDDPLLTDKSEKSDLVVDFGLGAYYRVPDKFYAGISTDEVLQTQEHKIYYHLKREYYLTGGYDYTIPGYPMYEILPSMFFQTDMAAYQLDLDALLMYNKKVWGGIGYRLQDAVSLLGGFNVKGLRIGLSYDISTSALSRYNNGSVEVMLNYCFKIKTDKFRRSYKNTRFL
ncbi:MAG: type IX secretion system membrane protein PorP/SprF [Bacteroidota bacterium]|nr:type IX secretion system membrane protein PorP/SprF [Bacteroidota bacterium]